MYQHFDISVKAEVLLLWCLWRGYGLFASFYTVGKYILWVSSSAQCSFSIKQPFTFGLDVRAKMANKFVLQSQNFKAG